MLFLIFNYFCPDNKTFDKKTLCSGVEIIMVNKKTNNNY